MKEIKRRFNPTILVLVETRCSGEVAQQAIRRIGFKKQIECRKLFLVKKLKKRCSQLEVSRLQVRMAFKQSSSTNAGT